VIECSWRIKRRARQAGLGRVSICRSEPGHANITSNAEGAVTRESVPTRRPCIPLSLGTLLLPTQRSHATHYNRPLPLAANAATSARLFLGTSKEMLFILPCPTEINLTTLQCKRVAPLW
jgi:hypothetical protein